MDLNLSTQFKDIASVHACKFMTCYYWMHVIGLSLEFSSAVNPETMSQ